MTDQENAGLGTRERILRTATAMFGEDPGARLSVRAVAARTGVSTGSLRYHFPTQRELQDAVLSGLYDRVASDDPIHDRSLPARDRLAACLRQVLAPAGVGTEAREAMGRLFHVFIEHEPTAETREAYRALTEQGRRRVEYWLNVLVAEGELAEGDNTRRARFLDTVLSGLATERALPAEESILRTETETLYTAVDCVLGESSPERPVGAQSAQ